MSSDKFRDDLVVTLPFLLAFFVVFVGLLLAKDLWQLGLKGLREMDNKEIPRDDSSDADHSDDETASD